MPSDYDALPALAEVMEAAGFHDQSRAMAALDRAETALGAGFHKARADIHAAREATEAGQWQLCWGRAYQAMCGLTGPFPPDPATCPPIPDDERPFRVAACACGADLTAGARFCATCGTPAPTA